jgi:hypothetical protein
MTRLGLHSGAEKSARIRLSSGYYPFRVAWFNCQHDGLLSLEIASKNQPQKTIPDTAFFRMAGPDHNSSEAALVSGLNYRCLEGAWTNLPNFEAQPPTKSGATSNLNLAVATRKDRVALEFQGFLRVEKECLGILVPEATGNRLAKTVFRDPRPTPPAAAGKLSLLTNCAQVQQLTREEAQREHPVKIQGVVVYSSLDERSYVIQDSTRVSVEAVLTGIKAGETEQFMELRAGEKIFSARLHSQPTQSERRPLGSRLRLAGTLAMLENRLEFDSFELLFNSSADITLLSRPPWWTLKRLGIAVSILTLGLTLASVWISLLRQQVERRTAQLHREISEREKAEHERKLELERARIACRVELPAANSRQIVPADARHHILLAVKEVLNNAVRHSQAGEISLCISVKENRLTINIRVNGCGFNPEQKCAGNGLLNLRRPTLWPQSANCPP